MTSDLHKYSRILIERRPFPELTLLCVAILLMIAVGCWLEVSR